MNAEKLLTPDELKQALLNVGPERYHHKHPFHLLMHEGKLTGRQLQAWALNRYYYQSRIPVKDAIILSRASDAEFRRAWLKRVSDHDGIGDHAGGIEKWIRLAEATGMDRASVTAEKHILPGVRFAVDAYLQLVSERSLLEAVASSLTEMFSRDLISLRMDAMRVHYPWLEPGLMYFTARLTQAPEDAAFALDYVTRHAQTRLQQDLAIAALRTKCDILWAQLDAIYFAYVSPGLGTAGNWPGTGSMMELTGCPKLKRGCRLSPDGEVLLIPESALRLQGPARHIVAACDGKSTVPQIVDRLLGMFPNAEPANVTAETAAFLSQLADKGVIHFV